MGPEEGSREELALGKGRVSHIPRQGGQLSTGAASGRKQGRVPQGSLLSPCLQCEVNGALGEIVEILVTDVRN